MSHAIAIPHETPVRTFRSLEWLPVFACELVMVAYLFTFRYYRTWYFATAASLTLIAFLLVMRMMSIRGVVRALFPIALYFGYLYGRAFFAGPYSAESRFYAAAVSIGIAIAFLFWAAVLNTSPRLMSGMWIRVPYYAAVVMVYYMWTVPESTRWGGWVVLVLPFCVPFCWAAIVRRQHRLFSSIALVLIFTILFISRSRSPLGAAGIAGLLAFFFVGRGVLQRIRIVLTAGIVAALILGALMRFSPASRLAIVSATVRLSGVPMVVDGQPVDPNPPDKVRMQLDEVYREMVGDAQPFGIGYRTFIRHYEQRYERGEVLHNIFQVWMLEGGAICVLIVFYIFLRHARALFSARHSRSPDLRYLAASTAIGTIALLALGWFHQVHEAPTFYAALGLGVAVRDLVQRERGRGPARFSVL